MLVILGVIAGVILLLGLWGVGSYNALVSQDTVVEQKSADVQSQLKRRADLVPNLVQTVKGYAKHETEVFKDIANARARLLSADVGKNPGEASEANAAFNSSLGRLLALAENYPNLKADQNFIRLQDELSGTENRINYARLQYNDSVKNYNLAVRSFPSNIIAGLSGFEKRAPFEASKAEQATPYVAF
ncbi:MAG: LemA family protein [Vampirovibrionales bacterium]|nr:LemA family protein [Vampirovibrionales bacterium]